MQGGTGNGPWDRALDDPDGLISDDSTRFERWVADLRVDDAARQRARRHWLRASASEEASLAGVFADLAEHGATVTVTTMSRRQHTGVAVVLGGDFVGLRTGPARHVVVALPAINAVRTAPETPAVPGDRTTAATILLSDVLVALAAERARVGILTGTDELVTGELRSVGTDVVVLRPSPDGTAMAYVALGAITEVLLDGPVISP